MAESIEIDLWTEYSGCELVCKAQVYNGSSKVKEWFLSDPNALISQAIEAGHADEVFEGIRMNQNVLKMLELFEIQKIKIKEK